MNDAQEPDISPAESHKTGENAVRSFKKKFTEWFLSRAHSHHVKLWLAALSFAESSFFPIPPDFLLIAILLAGAERWFYYATITTVASAFGGLLGYVLGYFFYAVIGAKLIAFYGFQNEVAQLGKLFADNEFWTIFTAAFTPIPYKVFTIAGGFFHVDLLVFFFASVVGRGLRFYMVAYLCKLYGRKLGNLIERYFNIFSIVVVILILLGFFLLKYL